MVTKTFRAPNMLSALQDVQREFGPDAIVLSMRELPPGAAWQVWRRAGCEVIAMRRPAKPASGAKPAGAPAAATQPTLPAEARPAGVETAERGVPAAAGKITLPMELAFPPAEKRLAQPAEMPAALASIRRHLLAQGVEETRVHQAVEACLQVAAPLVLKDDVRLGTYVRRYLEAGIRALARPSLAPPSRVMCLVGLSGSGKTSACAKLASFFGITLGKKVVWICADTVRTGAITEARTYADLLGAALELVYTPDEIGGAIAAHPEADLVLVDTPGCNPFQEDRVVDLAALLTQVPGRATYLVAAATTKETDLRQALASFSPLNLKGLIVTKTDETAALGSVYNFASLSQVPLAYFTNGSGVTGNLRVAEPADLVEAIFRGKPVA